MYSLISTGLLVIGFAGYVVCFIAALTIKNPRILSHFLAPATGLSLWCLLLWVGIESNCLPLMLLYTVFSVVSATYASQVWMRYMLKGELDKLGQRTCVTGRKLK